MMEPRRYGLLLACVLAAAGLAACGDNDDVIIDEADVAAEEGEAVGGDLAGRSDDELGGQPEVIVIARLGAIVLTLDDGEIAQADAALDRVDDPRVIDHAERMLDEHSLNAEELEDLLYARRITPAENAVSAALRAEAEAGLRELERAPDRQVDFAYMRMQVKMHAAAGVLVGRLLDHAPGADAALLDFLAATRDVIADHQLAAEAILRDL
jgi:putative membrane protein